MGENSFMSDMSLGFRRACYTVYVSMPQPDGKKGPLTLWAAFRVAFDRDGYMDFLKLEHPDWYITTKFPGRHYRNEGERFKYDHEA